MPDCIDCGKDFGIGKGTSICPECVDYRISQLSREELYAMARLGATVIHDEITGYQKIRPKGELRRRYKDFELEERLGGLRL